jgi:Domain of Unknown Function (DUF1080)
MSMRNLLAIIGVALAGLALSQEQTRQSNTLSSKEVADGWLLLFDGETSFGWKATAADKLTAKDGILRYQGPGKLENTTDFYQFALAFQCRVSGANSHDDVKITFAGKSIGIALPKLKNPGWAQGKLMVAAKRFKFVLTSERGDVPSESGDLPADGPTAISFAVADGATLELRDLTLMPLQMKSIFNGKNLEGWKAFPGKKSKFTVNDKLELHLEDGPGDLQTEAKYGDFLLQLECFSNAKEGKVLNSGVFFRCREGEYQNGYEAQIHNDFTLKPPKDYVVDDFDPVTHQSKGQHKVSSAARDWGTGAIYRRVPARKGVAKENEWFTLTVAANGNHFATWVNGIEVVDWTDYRPANSNPRNGFRLEPGHISLQGHDPTTDLNFRNIRINAFPASATK